MIIYALTRHLYYLNVPTFLENVIIVAQTSLLSPSHVCISLGSCTRSQSLSFLNLFSPHFMLTYFWSPRCIDLSLGSAGSQTVTRCGWTQLGVPAVLQDVVAVHTLDGKELWATQNVNHIVPEDSCGVTALFKGAADVGPARVLYGKP